VNMLDTGFDCPEVVNLVFARFTRSSILYQQMRGRGTRKAKGKAVFTMFDFVGVADYHGDEDGYAEGGIVVVKDAKKAYQPRRLLALEVDDQIDPTTREWITVDEDGNMVFPELNEQRASELGTRFEAWMLGQEDLDPGEESWLRMIGEQIRANVAFYSGEGAEFLLEQFAFHPFSQLGGLAQAVRVFGTEERLRMVIAGLNEHMFDDESGPKPATTASFAPSPTPPH
jgi:type I restriction enzyme R subunit